jgi:GNAT superfamily N-acetyltransferase
MTRQATLQDLTVLVQAADGMLEEYRKKDFAAEVDVARAVPVVLEYVDPLHVNKVSFITFAEDGEPQGVMLGHLCYYSCSAQYFATDRMFYVFPKFRSGLPLRRLIRAFEDWAKSEKCHAVKLNVLGSRDNEVLLKLLERMGYAIQGYEVGKLL